MEAIGDPATTELTGPTIVNPANPDLDYSYCASDRRHVLNVSLVVRTPEFENKTVGQSSATGKSRRSSGGSRAIVPAITTGVDNALTGLGGQRAVQVLDDPYGTGAPTAYLNRAAFTSPATGTYSTLAPFTVVNPSNLQNDSR